MQPEYIEADIQNNRYIFHMLTSSAVRLHSSGCLKFTTAVAHCLPTALLCTRHISSTMSSTSYPVSKKAPQAPRPSASLIIINASNEVLMVHRNPKSRSFAGAHVFPGGNYDKRQDSCLEMTALRETFEETGILLASRAANSPSIGLTDEILDDARKAIHSQKRLFTTFLSDYNLIPDITSLSPFSEWVTPPQAPRRFHARFFITFLPLASTLAGPTSGTHYHRLPTPDTPDASSDEGEVLSATFLHPRTVLHAFEQGELGLMPPQFYILSTLRDIFASEGEKHETKSTEAQRAQVMSLASGTFGRMIINPRGLPPNLPDGRTILTFEGDETRGGKKGTLHRVLLTAGKGNVPSNLVLLRNFNIFNELEDHIFSPVAKL